jgi:trehalose 6-phosphate phosphatase
VLPRSRTPEGQAGLDAIRTAPGGALIASDFDGTLSPIVPDPMAARAYPGAAQALTRLAVSVSTVAIITGRPAADAVALGGLASVPGLIVLGHYGTQRWQDGNVITAPAADGVAAARELLPAVIAGLHGPGSRPAEGEAAQALAGTSIEDKGTALAVHTRQAGDPARALELLRQPVADLASRTGLAVEPGRFVLELRPPGMDKGRALRSLAAERGVASVLFCGDDLGDLPAFAAAGALRAEGIAACTVASASPEVPAVAEAADLAVDGPAGVVALLSALADAVSPPGPGER